MLCKYLRDIIVFVALGFCLLLYFACEKQCQVYTCDEKLRLFNGDWVMLEFIDVYSEKELVFTRTFKSSLFFKEKVGTKKSRFSSDSTCFNWFVNCNLDSITMREDPSCLGKNYVFSNEDTYFIEKYSSAEIKLLKYFEQQDITGKILKHYNRYVLLK